jgi:23S rRNA pseudouridine955/2504/2580 synthase
VKTLTLDEAAFARSLVIFEDDHIIAFNKPSGLSSQGGRIVVPTLDDLMEAFAKSNGNRPRLVHRLDRDTSGLILAAKTKPAAGFLGKAMMGRRIRKTYLAIVAAAPDPRQGAVDAPLRREEIGRESYTRICEADHPDAQTARTMYRTLARSQDGAVIEARPQTGRMHQIRVHLASIERPIAGDVRYGGALLLAGLPAARLMLHASRLEFPHPAGGSKVLEAAPPADFMDLALGLGLEWNATQPAAIVQEMS